MPTAPGEASHAVGEGVTMAQSSTTPPDAPQNRRRERMLSSLLSSRGLLIAACILIGSWLLIWLVFALVTRAPFQSAAELSGLLAAIGGMMGAIFAVGGLVVALVAVLTQLQLQDRVAQVMAQARRELEDKFDHELRPSLDEQARRQVEGMVAFSQATTAADWRTALQLTRTALELYPKLRGARSFLGLRLSNDVTTYFWNRLHHVTTDYLSPYSRADTAYGVAQRAFVAPPWAQQTPIYEAADAPKLEAVEWLTQALEHGDDPEGQVSAALALMYGVNEAYDKMLDALPRALAANAGNRDSFLVPDHLVMLTFACGHDVARLEQLGKVLTCPLPLAREHVVATLHEADWTKTEYVDWYVLEAGAGAEPESRYPATVRVFRPQDSEGRQTWFAYVFPRTGRQITMPSPEADGAGQQRLPPRTLEELVGQLSRQYLFICATMSRL